MRRDFIVRHGLHYRDDLRVGEDFLHSASCLLSGARFAMVPQALYFYRLSDNSLTRSRDDAAGRTRELIEVNRALLEHSEVSDDHELRSAVAEREKEYGALLLYMTLVGSLRAGDYTGMVAELRNNLRLVPGLLVVVVVVGGALRRRYVVWRGGVSAFRGQRFGAGG